MVAPPRTIDQVLSILLIEHLLWVGLCDNFYRCISIIELKIHKNTPYLFDLIQKKYGKNRDIVFLERQKYTGKPKFGKLLIKKA